MKLRSFPETFLLATVFYSVCGKLLLLEESSTKGVFSFIMIDLYSAITLEIKEKKCWNSSDRHIVSSPARSLTFTLQNYKKTK